jgi:hypothetical protein
MSIDTRLKSQYQSCTAEEKLRLLRTELHPHLTTIQSYTQILTRMHVDQRSAASDDVCEWIVRIAQAGATAQAIVTALTDDS